MSATQHAKLREDIRRAVESGENVQDEVRRITLKALTGGGLDTEAMRYVAQEVSSGVQLGLEQHGKQAREVLEKAFTGLDEAFAKAAEATTLALQEVSGKTRDFVKGDLVRRMDDLKTLEDLYLDALRESARQGRDFASAAARQFAEHASHSGTAVGRQIEKSLAELAPLGRMVESQLKHSVTVGAETSALIARAASGFLAGIADRLETRTAGDTRTKGR